MWIWTDRYLEPVDVTAHLRTPVSHLCSVWSETSLLTCPQLKKTVEELNDALASKEEISQRCRELDLQVRSAWRRWTGDFLSL